MARIPLTLRRSVNLISTGLLLFVAALAAHAGTQTIKYRVPGLEQHAEIVVDR